MSATVLLCRKSGAVGLPERGLCRLPLGGGGGYCLTKQTVRKTVQQGYGVVSGGAKGIDSIAENEALSCGSTAVAYLSDSLLRKMRSSAVIRPVQDGTLVLLSVVKPDAGFQAGIAMMRNRYVYAQSSGTVIVRSDFNKGGTWSGAVDNLKHGWCP